MASTTIYADDSCWFKDRDRKFVEPVLGVGKWQYKTRIFNVDSVIRFPNTFASTLQKAKLNSCQLVFTASSNINRRISVNFTILRPDPTNATLQDLRSAASSTWETIGYIESGVRQNANAVIQITDKDIVYRILTRGLILFTNDTSVGTSFLYSSRAAVPANAPRLIIDYSSDSSPPAVRLVSPQTGTIDGGKAVTFRWSYAQDVGTPQSHYSLQYSMDNGKKWVSLANKKAGTASSYTAAAHTLPNGTMLWRVQVWSAAGIASEWAETTVLVQSAPQRPTISSVGSTPRPIVQWKSIDQQAYQLEAVGYYESGTVFGDVKRHQIPIFLPDGSVSIRMRIQNALGLWSDWASFSASISNRVDPDTHGIRLSARPYEGGVELKWVSTGSFRHFYIYRNDEPIAQASGSSKGYTDYFGTGNCKYQVRGVLTANDYYVMSGAVWEYPRMSGGLLSPVGDIRWIVLNRRRGDIPLKEKHTSRQTAYFNYDGRSLPVAQISEFVSRTHNYQYTISNEDAKRLDALCGSLVICKDNQGRRAIGVLNEVDFDERKRTDVSFSITEVDYKEFGGYEI